MDQAQLKAFVTSARLNSFSQAGTVLHLSQSAVSKRIASLETLLNARLFDRIGREVLLTEAGKVFLPHAETLLTAMADSVIAITNLQGNVGGRLQLGTSHHIGLHRLPPLLKQFRQRFPAVELQLSFMQSEAACAAVQNGELEIAIVTLPEKNPSLNSLYVWADPLAVVIANDHPQREALLCHSSQNRLACLTHTPAILPQSDTTTRAIVERAFAALGLSVRVELSTNYLETIKMLVRVGLGWSILPHRMLDTSITAIELAELRLQRRLGAVWHRQRTLSNAGRSLIQLLQQNLEIE